MDEVFHILLNI